MLQPGFDMSAYATDAALVTHMTLAYLVVALSWSVCCTLAGCFLGACCFRATSSVNGNGFVDLARVRLGEGRARITVNGRTLYGGSVAVVDGAVQIDGNTPDDCEQRYSSLDLAVHGSVQGDVRTSSGSVVVAGNVGGHVSSASGKVSVERGVLGNVSTMSGDVHVKGKIQGRVSTMSGSVY